MLCKEVPHLHPLLTHHLILLNSQGVHQLEVSARVTSGKHWLEHIELKCSHQVTINYITIGEVGMNQGEELDIHQQEGMEIMSHTGKGNSKEIGGGLIAERDRKHSEDTIILLAIQHCNTDYSIFSLQEMSPDRTTYLRQAYRNEVVNCDCVLSLPLYPHPN